MFPRSPCPAVAAWGRCDMVGSETVAEDSSKSLFDILLISLTIKIYPTRTKYHSQRVQSVNPSGCLRHVESKCVFDTNLEFEVFSLFMFKCSTLLGVKRARIMLKCNSRCFLLKMMYPHCTIVKFDGDGVQIRQLAIWPKLIICHSFSTFFPVNLHQINSNGTCGLNMALIYLVQLSRYLFLMTN